MNNRVVTKTFYFFQNEIKYNEYKTQSLSCSRSLINSMYYYHHFILSPLVHLKTLGSIHYCLDFHRSGSKVRKKQPVSIRSQSTVRFHFSLPILVLSPFPCGTAVSQIERIYLLVSLVIVRFVFFLLISSIFQSQIMCILFYAII